MSEPILTTEKSWYLTHKSERPKTAKDETEPKTILYI